MKTTDIHQRVTFKAALHDVYEALMDSRKHARFTGAPARISRKPGGTFSAYDGYITGVNIELVPDNADCPGMARQRLVRGLLFARRLFPEDGQRGDAAGIYTDRCSSERI